MTYATTNLLLIAQLRQRSCSEADIDAVRRAYRLSMRLFTAQFRPSGNTFIAHLVRTASIVADCGAPMPVIVAALAHAAYRYGEFGDGRRTATPAKRAEVAAAIGAESERLVYRYAEMPWRELLQRAADGVPCTSVEDAALMLIRVANEIEDHMDLTAPSRGIDADAHLRRCADAAACLGHAQLAAAIESARGEIATRATAEISHADDAVPDDAWSYAGAAGSFLLPPRSHRARAVPALRYRLRQSPLARVLYRRTLQLLR